MPAAIPLAVAAVGAAGSVVAANQAKKGAQRASDAQSAAAYAQMEQQQAQFDKIRELLQPFVNTGTSANTALGNLLGINGAPSQDEAITRIRQSGAFTSQLAAGENALLQNAAATGGLRGGNTQAALAKFAPMLLNNLTQQQIGNLSGLSQQGLQAAGGLSSGLQNQANANASALGQLGQAQAGGALGQANAMGGLANNLSGALGTAIGGFGGFGGSAGSGNLFANDVSPVTGLNSGVQYSTGPAYGFGQSAPMSGRQF